MRSAFMVLAALTAPLAVPLTAPLTAQVVPAQQVPAQPKGPQTPATITTAPSAPAREAGAPEAPVNGVVILYGNQRCPTNADGEEVVVCARRSAAEQFRVPKELRAGTIKPEYESFANRGQAILDATKTGIGSCEGGGVVGPGGGTGCSLQQMTRMKKADEPGRAAAPK